MLHHPEYRERYTANLKRELPRIPFLSTAGRQASEGESPGLQAGDGKRAEGASSLPKANAQPQAERHKQVPQGLKPLRDDKSLGVPERGAEAPLYQSERAVFHAFAEAGRNSPISTSTTNSNRNIRWNASRIPKKS